MNNRYIHRGLLEPTLTPENDKRLCYFCFTTQQELRIRTCWAASQRDLYIPHVDDCYFRVFTTPASTCCAVTQREYTFSANNANMSRYLRPFCPISRDILQWRWCLMHLIMIPTSSFSNTYRVLQLANTTSKSHSKIINVC